MSLRIRLSTLGRYVNPDTGGAVTIHWGQTGIGQSLYWVRRRRRQYVTDSAFAMWMKADNR